MVKPLEYNINLNESNAFKGLAIIAMLWHHLFYEHPEFGPFVHQTGLIGKVCVAMFLFASGYGLTVQFLSKLQTIGGGGEISGYTLRFILRRFVKFYMNYWVIFLIFVPVGVFVFGRTLGMAYGEDVNIAKSLLTDFFGLNGLYSYNVTWWFNALIIKLWILFPLLFLFASNRYSALLLLAVTFLKGYVFVFTLGICCAFYISDISTILKKVHPAINALLFLIAIAVLVAIRQFANIPYIQTTNLDGLIAMFILFFIVLISRISSYEWPILGYLGRHSMNMYMVHTFLFFYFFPAMFYGLKYPVLIFAGLLVASLSVSIAIEKAKGWCKFNQLQAYLLSKISKYEYDTFQ